MKKTIVYIAPHLSTGGMPQYLYKQMELLINELDIYCIEWGDVTGGVLVVQRNKIKSLLGEKLLTLGERKEDLFEMIKQINPDVVHLQEIPELFIPHQIAERLYAKDRRYSIIETSHDSSQSAKGKRFFPDKFLFVSQYQVGLYKELGIPSDVVEYPIEFFKRTKTREEAQRELGMNPNMKHVINVGLFTPRKNQAEIIEYAKSLKDQPIQFHFIGNQADNFKFYWEPIMKDFPSNCKWWNERTDVDTFYQAADLFLFTSRGSEHDKETMPLVIREAISWQVPSLIYNLTVYENYFDKYKNITYLDFNSLNNNSSKILEKVQLRKVKNFFTMNGEEDLKSYEYPNSTWDTLQKYGDAAAQYFATYILKELEPNNFKIEKDSVFVDLGANIGMSSRYAKEVGAREIICFEPDSNLIEIIEKNIPQAKIYRYAIANKKDSIELYHWPFNVVNTGPKYKVDVITLKDVLKLVDKDIDYLKIDIEGFEDGIFDDLTTQECAKIKKLFLEHHNPEKTQNLVETLKSKGFDLFVHYGMGQNYIYANYKTKTINMDTNNYKIHSRWDLNEQKIYYSSESNLNFPIIVSIKEYKSDAVLWATKCDNLPAGIEFWMVPIFPWVHNYSTDPVFTGIKFCIYKANNNEEQIYECPYFHKFVDKPTISMSNLIPYYVNYNEFFVQRKYDKFLNRGFDFVVDVGANVGMFSKYLLEKKLAKKIMAIECDTIALKDLQRNFDTNDRVEVIPKAFHYSDKPVTFYQSKDNPVISSTLSPDKLEHHMAGVKGDVAYTVDTITIEQILLKSVNDDSSKYGRISLLKIDIEGGEYDVIENTKDYLFDYIENLMIECHFFEKDYREKYERLKSKLVKLGYYVEEYKENQIEMIGASESIFATKTI